MQEYVRRRQATIADYIVGCPIFELCTQSKSRDGCSRFLHWWDQDYGKAEKGVD